MFPAGVAPAASRFANGRASVAPREREEVVRYASAALALSGWKPDVLAVTPMPPGIVKKAARAGIAPASSRLQRAAHLSELSGDGYVNGRTPRCCAGLLLIPNQAGTLAPSCP